MAATPEMQIPVCSGDAAWSSFNLCFPQTMDPVEATIERGKTLTVPYHLKSRLTGDIFAAAGVADDNIKVGVSLSLGVSASGIPLSPATLADKSTQRVPYLEMMSVRGPSAESAHVGKFY